MMMTRLYMFSPLIVFVWALLEGYSPFRAGGLGIVAALIAGWLSRMFRDIGTGDASMDPRSVTMVFTALLMRIAALVAGGAFLYVALQYLVPLVRSFGDIATWSLSILVILIRPYCSDGGARWKPSIWLRGITVQLVAVCACAGIIDRRHCTDRHRWQVFRN
ncbi:MAG: hypothetical protein KIT13_03830 [Burkholderiales bacterium]|nr:hypothetical protein [Burkholderiales bacterium]